MNDKEQMNDDANIGGGNIGNGNPEARKNMRLLGAIFTVAAAIVFTIIVLTR